MDCSEVKELLSAYYDGELPSDQQTAMAEHLTACADCAHELEGFRNLSAMAEGLTHPEPPAYIWQQLEKQLDAVPAARPERPTLLGWRGWTRMPAVRFGLAMAAAIVIAVGWFGYTTWFQHGSDHEFAAVFARYLEEFPSDPSAAQQLLLANYKGQAVDAEQAIRTVGYRPAVADGMPEGYSVEATYVMEMPCCTCVQCLCKRSDGTTISIFEHDDEQTTEWFGDLPEISAVCNGTQCSLVEMNGRIAANWVHGERHITAIGLRDAEEVGQLAAWFAGRKQNVPQ